MFLLFKLVPEQFDLEGNPASIPSFLVFLFPILYLIVGYIGGAICSLIYNLLAKITGGFQFELKELA